MDEHSVEQAPEEAVVVRRRRRWPRVLSWGLLGFLLLVAAALLGERPGPWQLAGAAVIAAGLVVARR